MSLWGVWKTAVIQRKKEAAEGPNWKFQPFSYSFQMRKLSSGAQHIPKHSSLLSVHTVHRRGELEHSFQEGLSPWDPRPREVEGATRGSLFLHSMHPAESGLDNQMPGVDYQLQPVPIPHFLSKASGSYHESFICQVEE